MFFCSIGAMSARNTVTATSFITLPIRPVFNYLIQTLQDFMSSVRKNNDLASRYSGRKYWPDAVLTFVDSLALYGAPANISTPTQTHADTRSCARVTHTVQTHLCKWTS